MVDPWSEDALSEGNDWSDTDDPLESDGDDGFVDPEELEDEATWDDDADE